MARTGPRSPSLSFRLVAGAMVWLAVMLAVGGFGLAFAFRQTVEREFSQRLDAMLLGLMAVIEASPEGTIGLVRPHGDPRFGQVYSGWYWQVVPPGQEPLRSRSLWDAVIPGSDSGNGLHIRQAPGPAGEALLVAERDFELPGIDGRIHALVAGDLGEVNDGVRHFNLLLASSLGLLGLGLAMAVLIQVRFGLKPLRRMAQDLGSVRDGARARLDGRYPREVMPLAEAMNAVLESDAVLIERARTHVGNLAHGLKTPLAILAAEAEGAADRKVLKAQVRTMRRLIDHHLGRAAAVAGAGRVLGMAVPLRAVVAGLAAALGRIFAERDLAFDIDIPEDLAFRGQREDLEEILGNLMENAAKWAARRVRVSGRAGDGGLLLTVEDDGPGLSPEQAEEASRRGRRLDEMAPGWGLGLAIVADLVDLNGGSLAFSRSELGGLAVRVGL
ncbi:sensor histidine kinase [Magnetospirillum sp. UT-4]|uniref:sensor histidine kinase n=1 Tax=Magnetospirillum sp. UT-4 TaxID=2681467 RepID=UPI0013855867|nr:sensor histidine kinase [Magnetospirillum sp. UT-4]CAA7615094.1 putative Two-component sensor histidine kinase [Magnetospirillum sp. UT-4]